MNVTAIGVVARKLLPTLTTLVLCRKQARWQHSNCADENKHKWTEIVQDLDARIVTGEHLVADVLDIPGFRVKREIIA